MEGLGARPSGVCDKMVAVGCQKGVAGGVGGGEKGVDPLKVTVGCPVGWKGRGCWCQWGGKERGVGGDEKFYSKVITDSKQ